MLLMSEPRRLKPIEPRSLMHCDPGIELMSLSYVMIPPYRRDKILSKNINIFQIGEVSPELAVFKVGLKCQVLLTLPFPALCLWYRSKHANENYYVSSRRRPIFKKLFYFSDIYYCVQNCKLRL